MTSYRLAELIPDTLHHLHSDARTRQLLFNRGIKESAVAERFLSPSYDTHLHDPFLFHDMEVAVQRLLTAISEKEQIVVFSDYDCDGIPGGVVMHDFLVAIGHESFSNYIPHRHFEGFGLSTAAVEKAAEGGATLIITIDCGTSDVAAVARANELGIDVIITDHHEPGSELPEAVAVINPKVGDTYPFDGLCGAAVVYKFVQATLARGSFDLVPGYEKWWLDMVGVATIADMVPLTDENRVLARYGLAVLRKSRRPGLQHLLRKSRASQRHLTEDDIGFTIGPRINAASRMGTPLDAFYVLTTKDEGEAGRQVEALEKLNNERKGLVAAVTKEIHGRLKKLPEIPAVLVLGSPEWRPALVGLSATKLAEEYRRPTFLWGRDGMGVIKGSCRSDGRVSVVGLMDAAKHLFSEYGGHHFSGGFSVIDEQIHAFPTALVQAFTELGEQVLVDEEVIIDARLTLEDINTTLITSHQTLAPFGEGNPKPLYEFQHVTPTTVECFGKGKEHLKLTFMSLSGPVEAIAFFKTPADFYTSPVAGEPLNLIAHVEQSFFMGRLQTRLRIVDIL